MPSCARTWMAIAIAVTCGVGCKDKPQDKAIAPAGGSAPAVAARGKVSDLDLLPVDAELVLGVQWTQLQGTALWKQLALPALMAERDFVEILAEIKTRCGIDVMTQITRFSLGLKTIEAEVPDGAAVVHGLDRAQTLACVDKWKPDALRQRVALANEGGVVTALDDDRYGIGLVFVEDDTALVMMGHAMSTERVRNAAAGSSMLRTSPAFVDMYGKINPQATVWALVRGTAMQAEVADLIGLEPTAVFGFLDLGDGLSGRVRARMGSADQATRAAASLRGQLEAVAPMVDKAEVSSDGADVELEVAASSTKLTSFIQSMADEP